MKLRGATMGQMIEYIKSLASGPEMISRMVNIGYDAQQKMIGAAASWVSAEANAKGMIAKVSEFNSSMTFDANKANQASKLQIIEDNLKALLGEIAAITQQATAALNNLQVHVSMQAGGTTVTTQSQEV